MVKLTTTAACTALVGWIAGSAWADEFADQRLHNWHQWRGPLATGVAPLGDPPTEWDADTNLNIKWKVAIPGRGSASPIVWQDRIYVLTAIKTDRQAELPNGASAGSRSPARLAAYRSTGQSASSLIAQGPGTPTNYYQFVVLCLDRRTGQTLWQRIACEAVPHQGHHDTGSFASASPITDGRNLYASFGSRGICCYDLDGNLQWQRDLGDMEIAFSFGEGASPALDGDTLVVNWDHQGQSFITALDARTGQPKWKVERDEPTSWCTPVIVRRGAGTQVVVNGTNRARGYDLKTGDVLWECGGQSRNPIPSPVVLDDVAYCMTGFRTYSLYAIPLGSSGDITDTDQIA